MPRLSFTDGWQKANAPAIIQASKGANSFQGGPDKIAAILKLAMKNMGHDLPICLHLDHGSEEAARECVDKGFSSVMIDASKYDFEENVAKTKEIVGYARSRGVTVEGAYGKLEGVEEDVVHEKTTYADAGRVPEFFQGAECDALAIAYGTSHGPNKGGNLGSLKTEIVKGSYEGMAPQPFRRTSSRRSTGTAATSSPRAACRWERSRKASASA